MYTFLDHITVNPKILGGKPVIKNTRIPINIISQMVRDKKSFQEIVKEYPRLDEEDIKAVLDYCIFIINNSDEDGDENIFT
jgi:uncharacterized protein (DUF433 family)